MYPVIWCLFFLMACEPSSDQAVLDYETEVDRIGQVATIFSKALIEENIDALMACYTDDAIIFPPRMNQVDSQEGIRSYWTPNPDRDMIYHMIIPERIELHDSTAIDYGVYEGQSVINGDTLNPFQGKYFVVWKLDAQNNWKMKYDIWNSSPSNVDSE